MRRPLPHGAPSLIHFPAPTLICGYCAAERRPDAPCRCPARTQAQRSRDEEIHDRLQVQRLGVACWGSVPRGTGQ